MCRGGEVEWVGALEEAWAEALEEAYARGKSDAQAALRDALGFQQ